MLADALSRTLLIFLASTSKYLLLGPTIEFSVAVDSFSKIPKGRRLKLLRAYPTYRMIMKDMYWFPHRLQ